MSLPNITIASECTAVSVRIQYQGERAEHMTLIVDVQQVDALQTFTGASYRWLKTTYPTHSDLASLAARSLEVAIGERETHRSRLSTHLDQLVRLAAGASPTSGEAAPTSVTPAVPSVQPTPLAKAIGRGGEIVPPAKR